LSNRWACDGVDARIIEFKAEAYTELTEDAIKGATWQANTWHPLASVDDTVETSEDLTSLGELLAYFH